MEMESFEKSWNIAKLNDVCKELTSGGAAPQGEKYFINGLYSFVRVADMGQLGKYDKNISKTKDMLNNSGTGKLRLFPNGTVLFTKSGASLLLNQRAVLKSPMYVVSHIGCMIPNATVTSDWLYYYMKQVDFAHYAHATTLPSLKLTTLKDIDIPVPSLPEQERIVARIEELFSELDKAVETLQTTKQQLTVYRQAVLKEAFSGEHPLQLLKDLCFFITKGTTPKKDDLLKEGDIPFIKVYNLTFNNTLDFTIEPAFVTKEIHMGFLARSIVLPGDVLMNIVGPPMGKISIVPDTYSEWNINQAIARFRCNEKLHNKYLAHYLGFSATVEKMVKQSKATAGQLNLTLEICRNISIPLPSIEEQKKIVTEIESRLSVCDSIEQTVNTTLAQADAIRQSILKQAFEGRLA